MILHEIVMADCTSILLMIILLVSRYITRRQRNTEDKFFLALVLFGLSGAILELIAFLVDGRSGGFFKFVNVASNSILYCVTATMSVIWLWYVDYNLNHDPRRIRTIFLPFVIVWGMLILSVFGNIFGEYLFKFDANNVYARMPLGYIFYGFLIACFIASIVDYIVSRVKHGETQFFPIWMFLIPVILACVIQVIWYGIAAAWLGCAIGISAIYLNIQSRFSLIDNLTGLYNRTFIEHKLIVARGHSKKYVYGGIMLDIDDFKLINDTFGHSMGDDALRQVSRILINASDNKTLIFRFAGDEFVLLMKLPVSQKDELLPKMIELENAIRKGAKEFNETGESEYDLVFSIGHAIFDSSLPDDEFFRQMDIEMYKEKKSHHK